MLDRLDRGFILGVTASSVKDVINLVNFSFFHVTNIRYLDFMANIILGRPVRSLLETILCQIVELGYEGMIGVIFFIFAYHSPYHKNLWFKGILLGELAYLANYALASVFRLPVIHLTDAKTLISQVTTSAVFGALMGIGLNWWGKKIGDLPDNSQLSGRGTKNKW